MSPPLEFEKVFSQHKVYKLKKSLHGLKQSPRVWFKCFGKAVKSYDYHQSQADHTLFYKDSEKGKISILIIYVDDIILTRDDLDELANLKRRMT